MMNQASTSQSSNSAGGQAAFLRRVTADDRFRAQLEADPQAALAAFGLHVDSEQLPSEVNVPSAESILDILIDVESDGSDVDRLERPRWEGFFCK